MSLSATITTLCAILLLGTATLALASPAIENVGTLPWEESDGKTPLLNLKNPQPTFSADKNMQPRS